MMDEARSLSRASEILDLHIDTLIPVRLWGFDPLEGRRRWPLCGRVPVFPAETGGEGSPSVRGGTKREETLKEETQNPP